MKRWTILAAISLCMGVYGSVSAAESDLLLANPGFEDPPLSDQPPNVWFVYGIDPEAVVTYDAEYHDGKQSVILRPAGKPNAAVGIIQRVPVEGGEDYEISVQVRNNRRDPLKGAVFGQIVVEWVGEDGNEISRTWSDRFLPSLSRLRWTAIRMRDVRAPRKAVEAVFGIHLYEGATPAQGSIFVDDFEVEED